MVDAGRLRALLTRITERRAHLGAANHIVASEGYRSPADYADAFRVLTERAVVGSDLGRRLEAMARFRNLLVHVYAEVDNQRVHRYLREDLADLEAFVAAVLAAFPDLGTAEGSS